jgi:hypothetical protein
MWPETVNAMRTHICEREKGTDVFIEQTGRFWPIFALHNRQK